MNNSHVWRKKRTPKTLWYSTMVGIMTFLDNKIIENTTENDLLDYFWTTKINCYYRKT